MRELLPEYAAQLALGKHPEELYRQVAEHLQQCEACRAELNELLDLTIAAYTGQVEPAASYPQADLSFLYQESARVPDRPWLIDALGRLVITFSEGLLATAGRPSLAGAARGQLLYRYVQDPESVHDLAVTIEVFADERARDVGRVQVVVDVPSRGPLDQTGSQVVLRFGDAFQQGETDESGCVSFAPVPLAALPRLRVEVLPRREV